MKSVRSSVGEVARRLRGGGRKVGNARLERVAPAEAGEAAEVGVAGVEFGLVFDGEGGDVGVGDQVAADARGSESATHEDEVLPAGVQGRDVGCAKPQVDEVQRLLNCRRMLTQTRMRQQAYESNRDYPRDPNSFRPVEQPFPPMAGRTVKGRAVVLGVEQQIDLRNDHSRCSSINFRCSSRKSSTSSWSLSWLSFMGSMPGRNPPRSGRTRNTGRSSGASGARPRRRASLTTCLNGTSSSFAFCLRASARSSSRVRVVRMEASKHH